MIGIEKEFKTLIPPLTPEEKNQLEQNIVADGCRDPLVVWGGILVDGHNRYEICTRLNIPFTTKEMPFEDRSHATEWIIKNQFGRRNLVPYVRTQLALKLESEYAARAKENKTISGEIYGRGGEKVPQISAKPINPIDTRKEIAKIAGVSHDTVAKVKKIESFATAETKASLATGEISINQAHKEIVKRENRVERVQKIAEISQGNVELKTDKTYPVIYADPPWRYDYAASENRAIENQYPTMTLEDICALEIPATQDSVLFLWVTSPKLEEGLRVIREWGFTYRTCAVWDKQKMGMGYYFRQQHELLLVATKGSIPAPEPANRPRSVISVPYDGHSSKPAEVAEMIEDMYPELDKLEMFCREPRAGWSVWGNQSDT